MNENELLDLWQSSADDQPPTAFTVRELAHRAPVQRAGTGRLPPVSADCATFLAATLEAHRSKTLARLQVREFFAAGRAIDRLQDLMGWSPRASAERPVLALSLVMVVAVSVAGLVLWTPKIAPAEKTVTPDPATQIEGLRAECRTYASPEAGLNDWSRANAACQKVLELEPLDPEANAQVKRIAVLQVCEQRLKTAQLEISAGRPETALESLTKMGKDCEIYLLRSMSIAKETAAEVKRSAARDCKAYADNGKWDLALKRCELYSRLACRETDPRDLYPPALMKVKLEGSLNPKTEWRPSDPLYVDFLKARAKLRPGAPTWACPDVPALCAPPAAPDPGKLAREELASRYPEPELGRALVLYFQGHFAEAPVPLQKLGEKMSKAQYHEEARALLLDIVSATDLYETGFTELTSGHPERAEAPFLAALAADERLMLGARASTLTAEEKKRELARRVSFVRRAITDTMASGCYEKGKALADRNDFRNACRYWKLGSSFARSNIDLLKALTNVCTKRAEEAFAGAETCEQLKATLDFAVDGDGFKEKISETMIEQGCP